MPEPEMFVLGLGNILYGDEGFGVRVVERLYAAWDFPPTVELVDGGTLGHTLLGYVEQAQRLLVIDAVDFGLPPGTLTVREHEDIPAWLTALKISPHQNSFSEVLALAALRGYTPQLRLIGVQPGPMSLGSPLSSAVRNQIDEAARLALETLYAWGVTPTPAAPGKMLHDPSLTEAHCSVVEQPENTPSVQTGIDPIRHTKSHKNL